VSGDPDAPAGGGPEPGADAASAAAPGLRGPDLARAALSQAKAAARAKGLSPGGGRPTRRPGPIRSGPAADARDPEPFGAAVRRLVTERGWEDTTAAAGVLTAWPTLVGAEIADHCQPQSLVDGELVLVAESSAWATQLRLLTRTLLATLRAHTGPDVVRTITVRGPAQPDWRRGPRRVQGRGPRDTYG
jgi:predicted nucleic acid-binding Zn ribbon protein